VAAQHRRIGLAEGRPPDCCVEYRYVRRGNGVNLEMFQYTSPDQKTEGPKNSDVRGHHLTSFYVDDMNATIGHLKAHGVRVLDKPIMVPEGPAAGLTWIYFLAPRGMNLELASCENGIAHDKSRKTLLWEPETPGERLVNTD
jgi:extradiol dioxygenase family protein